MSDHVPRAVAIVGWSGDVDQLALRLGISETVLLAALRRHGRQEGRRLTVDAPPANSGPILAALRRRLNQGDADGRA
jgi:hypothetical protein